MAASFFSATSYNTYTAKIHRYISVTKLHYYTGRRRPAVSGVPFHLPCFFLLYCSIYSVYCGPDVWCISTTLAVAKEQQVANRVAISSPHRKRDVDFLFVQKFRSVVTRERITRQSITCIPVAYFDFFLLILGYLG